MNPLTMKMRAIEEITIGEDLTPPLRPLAAVLHDSAVTSHCSACFATLPRHTFPQIHQHAPTDDTPTPLYCSLACYTADSSLHFSSAERHLLSLFARSPPSLWQDSSDLRLSLRLAHIFVEGDKEPISQESEDPDGYSERIAGLMTNREKLVYPEIEKKQIEEDCDENSENFLRIREGAKMMAKARSMHMGKEEVNSEKCFAFEEMVLCLVMTNAVEVQEMNGRCIGVAVYDHTFSWINHSCSPNSCYRFSVGPEEDDEQLLPLRIAPAAEVGCGNRNADGLKFRVSDRNGYGPRVVVRSVKAISKGDEVTIAYTDLLRPKEMRQAELWSKYKFNCSCKRCGAVPRSYVDYALQVTSDDDYGVEKTMQDFECTISDYLSSGDAKSCCEKLEGFLCHGGIGDYSLNSPPKLKLRPFSHLSLSAYVTLASAYKVRASDLSALSSVVEGHKLEALNMYRTSCAYSLLLAGIVNHLFIYEPGIVSTAANFWISAGESLLVLLWNNGFMEDEPFPLELSSLLNLMCDDCSCMKDSDPNTDQKMHLEETKSRMYHCIAKIAPKVWSLLSSGNGFMKFIKDPVDLSWLESAAVVCLELSETNSTLQVEICSDEVRMNLIVLGIHCCRYGALLSSICYGFSIEMYYRKALEGVVKKHVDI